jgi:hypothetical protein
LNNRRSATAKSLKMFAHIYWIIPIISGFVWLGMLLGMLLWWLVDKNSEHLTPMKQEQHIAFVPSQCPALLVPAIRLTKWNRYISDIGAHTLQPLFIAAGTVTVVTFTLTFIAERWLRHRGRLVRNDTKAQKILSVCSIIAAIAGAIGLIILTCLNDVHHHTAHDTCLVIFM